jgi:hypothetical protein
MAKEKKRKVLITLSEQRDKQLAEIMAYDGAIYEDGVASYIPTLIGRYYMSIIKKK